MPDNYVKPGTSDSIEFDRNHIWHPFSSLQDDLEPLLISSAEGIYLHTPDGRKIIDAVSSWWVNIHGHANQEIAEAIYQQAKTLEHVIFAGFTHEPALSLTRNLLRILPSNQQRIFFSDNGSTAVEVGLKMAMQYWFNQNNPKTRVIALHGAYHGDTFGAMSIGSRSSFTKPFEPYLFEVDFIDVPTEANFDQVITQFNNILSTNQVAAFIYEPLVQGAAGMVMYSHELLDLMLEQAQRSNVICVADEVFTGFGRTGKTFASDYLTFKPDIMAVSKGITGGALPLGVTTCSRKIEQAFQTINPTHTFFHGHSYTANPIACAAANASFKLLTAESCTSSINRITDAQKRFVQKIKSHPIVNDARSCGTIMALEIKTEGETSYFNSLRKSIYSFFLGRDILLRPLGNIIYVVPPYVIKPEELNHVHAAIEEFLESMNVRKER